MAYGPTKQRGIMSPPIVAAGAPISGSMQLGEFGYRAQEMAGIYGFGFSSLREKFGFGEKIFSLIDQLCNQQVKHMGVAELFGI